MAPPAKQQGLDFSKPIFGRGIVTNAPPAKEEEEGKGGIDFSKPVFGKGIITNAPSRQAIIEQEQKRSQLAEQRAVPGVELPLAEPYSEADLTRLISRHPLHPDDYLKEIRMLPERTAEDAIKKEATIREFTGLDWQKHQGPILDRWHKENPKGREAYLRRHPDEYFDEKTHEFKKVPSAPSPVRAVKLGTPPPKPRNKIVEFISGLPDEDLKEWKDRSGFEKHGILGLMPDALLMQFLGLDEAIAGKRGLQQGRETAGIIAGWHEGQKKGKILGWRGRMLGGGIGSALGLIGVRGVTKGELPPKGEQAQAFFYGTLGHGRFAAPLARGIGGGLAEGALVGELAKQSQSLLDEGELLEGDPVSRNLLEAAGNALFRGLPTRALKGQSHDEFLNAQATALRKAQLSLLKNRLADWKEKATHKPGKSRNQVNKAKKYRDFLDGVINRIEEYGNNFEAANQHEATLISQAVRAQAGRKSIRDSLDALIVRSEDPLAWALASGTAKEVPELVEMMKQYAKEGKKGVSPFTKSGKAAAPGDAVRDQADLSPRLKELLERVIKDTDKIDLPPAAKEFLSLKDKARRNQLTYAAPWGAFQRKIDKLYGSNTKYNLEWALENRGINSKQIADVAAFDKVVTSRLDDASLRADFNSYALIKRIKMRLETATSKKKGIKDLESHIADLKGMIKKGDRDMFEKAELREHDRNIRELENMLKGWKKRPEDRIWAELSMDGKPVYYVNNKSGAVADGVNIQTLEKEFYDRISKTDPNRLAVLRDVGKEFQRHAGKLRSLRVDSGLLSKEAALKMSVEHKIYYPFAHLEHVADTTGLPGPITGVNRSWRIVDIPEQMRHQIFKSREAVERNNALRELLEYGKRDLKEVGGEGQFIRRAGKDVEPPEGWKILEVKINGHPEKFMVDESVVRAYEIFADPTRLAKFTKGLGKWFVKEPGKLVKAGTTKYSIPFQLVNMGLSDALTNALTAKTGLRWYGLNPVDWAMFATDNAWGLWTALRGNANKLPEGFYKEALEQGLLRSTMSHAIDPLFQARRLPPFEGHVQGVRTALGTGPKAIALKAKDYVDILPDAIEEMGKLVAMRRAVRFGKAKSLTDLLKNDKEFTSAILKNEFFKQSGSPQFSRFGEAARTVDQVFMFYNARMQGVARDLHRITDIKSPEGRAAMFRVGAAIAGPSAYLESYNLTNNREWLDKVPRQVRDNYWIVFKHNMIEMEDGTEMKDYYRIPKRDVFKLIANVSEMAVGQVFHDNPRSIMEYVEEVADNISPVNFKGEGWQEKLETVVSGTTPWAKYGYELAAGDEGRIRSSWTHRYLLTPDQAIADDPSLRKRRTTGEGWGAIASVIGVGPEHLKHAVKTFTGDMATQFLPEEKPVKGREGTIWENPIVKVIGRRFIAPVFTQNEAQKRELDKLDASAASDRLRADAAARKWVDENAKFEIGSGRKVIPRYELNLKLTEDYGGKEDRMIYDRAKSLMDKRERGMPFDLTSLRRRQPKDRAEAIKFMVGQFQSWGWSNAQIQSELFFLEDQKIINDEVYKEMGVLEGLEEAALEDILRVGRAKFEESKKK